MTMTVVHANGDQAQIMTDGLAYNASLTYIIAAPEAKATVLEHFTAAVASRGSYVLGRIWEDAAARLAARVASFDEFAEAVPSLLRTIAERGPQRYADYSPTTGEHRAQVVQAYAVGWSPAADGFRALLWDGLDGFACEDITGTLHVTPAPVGCPPTAAEQRARARNGVDPLPEGKPARAPQTDAEWRLLAETVHKGRAQARADSGLKVPVGGDVTLTTLTRHGADQRVIHRFTAEDFEAMVAGTFHSWAQLGPCATCDSGQRWVDCCLPKVFGEPCVCGSGETFGDCCKVDADTAEPVAA